MASSIQETDWPDDWRQAAEKHRCLHCENDLGKFWQPAEGPFCCRGCRGVYRMIHESDLERYYDLKIGAHAPAAHLRPDSHDWLDRLLADQNLNEPADKSSGSWHLSLDIQGVHCAACVWLIEELFQRQAGGIQLRINPTMGTVEVTWDPAAGDLKVFLSEVEKFGYRLGPARKGGAKTSRGLLMRMAVSISMALNVMMFSLSYYFGLAPVDGTLYTFLGWLSLALATVSLIAGGGIFFQGAIAGLKRGIAHLDVPISLGMILAYAGSAWGFLTAGPENAYFDSLTIFIALMLVGRWAQEHILERNRNALLDSAGAENLTTKRLKNGELEMVAATDILRGDELWIAPGDLLPADGILMRRATEVSLDWISGESDQVAYQPGEVVPAGAFNASEHGFSVTASEDFADSRLQDLLRTSTMVDEDYRPQWWHRISTWYVALVLIAATIGFVGWLRVDVATALKVTISILVVTCPCALGLATPLAEELIHFALRRAGVFLRTASFLEKALAVRKVLLDKTGTLTLGQLVLAEQSSSVLANLDPTQRGVLRHMTARSNHPVSLCLAGALGRGSHPEEAVNSAVGEDLREIPGAGLELDLDGRVWRLGREDFAEPSGAKSRQIFSADEPPAATKAATVFTVDGAVVAQFVLTEEFKVDATAELESLRNEGYEIFLLSGDTQQKVTAAAQALAMDPDRAFGGLTPEAKAEQVRRLDRRDTLMVGDGLNDSPSFEAAFCAATPAVDRPVLPGKADFYFLGDGIAAIRRSLLAARHLRRVVRSNLAVAIGYNVLAVGLCLAGLVTPVIAAILMPVSSVTVVTLTAVRLSRRRLTWM
jgi:P-type Cu2+ transporter